MAARPLWIDSPHLVTGPHSGSGQAWHQLLRLAEMLLVHTLPLPFPLARGKALVGSWVLLDSGILFLLLGSA